MLGHIQPERANLVTPAPPRTDECCNHPGTTITDTLLSDPRPLLGRQKLSLSWSARTRTENGIPRGVRRNAFAICARRFSAIIAPYSTRTITVKVAEISELENPKFKYDPSSRRTWYSFLKNPRIRKPTFARKSPLIHLPENICLNSKIKITKT